MKSSTNIVEEMSDMLDNETFHDMKIKCGNEIIPCNKFILCARYAHYNCLHGNHYIFSLSYYSADLKSSALCLVTET